MDEMNLKKMNAILAAIPWRCFHCDFITNDPAEAQAHFGDMDDASEFVPICKWWSEMPEDERKHTLQDLQRELTKEQDENGDLRLKVEDLEERLDSAENSIRQYKPFKDCHSAWAVFSVYDSMEGRALAAEEREKELVEALNDKGMHVYIADDRRTIIKEWKPTSGVPQEVK